jgi:quercetin dioxygenase-like cupin family protein
VAAVFAHGGPLLATNNFKVMALRRNEPGEVEVHDRDTDILYVLEGSASLVTGGSAIEPRTTAPGETRAKTIAGGEERRVAKGDVVVIPKRRAALVQGSQRTFPLLHGQGFQVAPGC